MGERSFSDCYLSEAVRERDAEGGIPYGVRGESVFLYFI